VDTQPDASFRATLDRSLRTIVAFSAANDLGVHDARQFFSRAVVYGSKVSFDAMMRASPGWPKDKAVPRTFVGVGVGREFRVVTWAEYRRVHPDASHDDYQRLVTHELTHLFHIAVLGGDEDKMGPVWFYEGFACLVAGQYADAVLPPADTLREVLASRTRGSYRTYVAMLRVLASKGPIRELVRRASQPGFNHWAEARLLGPPPP